MENHREDWRSALTTWLVTHPRTMPSELLESRQEFLRRFPQDKISNLTLEEFGAGQGKGTFCYWIEFGTTKLANISGAQANKFGLWFSRDEQKWKFDSRFTDVQDALESLKRGIVELLNAAKKQDFAALDSSANPLYGKNLMRGKILYLYYPDLVVPFFVKDRLRDFLSVFGETPRSDELIALNRQLLEILRTQPEFENFDTQQMMRFLSDAFPKRAGENMPEQKPIQYTQQIEILQEIAKRTRNIILYGPPGTGKTWTVNQFAAKFLDAQIQQPQTREQIIRKFLADATWAEATALAMIMHPKKLSMSVPEIMDTDIMRVYSTQIKNISTTSQAIWAHLQIHTDPNSTTVQYAQRSLPYLFDKVDKGRWVITNEGKEVIEELYKEALEALRRPQNPNRKRDDFF